MLIIVCVNAGNYLGRGTDYVDILADMVARNISKEVSYKFICFTDTPGDYDSEIDVRPLPFEGLDGWWNKLALFKDGIFPDGDRILYLDLDTVITSGLDEIIKYEGEFAILRDFYRPDGLQSSVMIWRVGVAGKIWQSFQVNDFPKIDGGDQAWIERCAQLGIITPDILQDLYPHCFVSYKVHAKNNIPKSAKMVVFHGQPRPHDVTDGWMPYVWKIGGGTTLELKHVGNVAQDVFKDNIRNALKLPFPWLQMAAAHEGHAAIIGGGPSLKDDIEEIRQRQRHGQVIFSTNNTYNFLVENGIIPDCQVMIDARAENKEFIRPISDSLHYLASQCHPQVFDKVKGKNVVLFHSFFSDGIFDIIGNNSGDPLVGGGSTVCLHSIALAWILGYRNFHLYGMDSSYDGESGHAYAQVLNDNDKIIEVGMNDKRYRVAPWMATQLEDFKELAKEMIERGCVITVHGKKLLPDAAKLMCTPDTPDKEMVCKDGTWWPSKCTSSRLNSDFTFDDIKTVISACDGKKSRHSGGG